MIEVGLSPDRESISTGWYSCRSCGIQNENVPSPVEPPISHGQCLNCEFVNNKETYRYCGYCRIENPLHSLTRLSNASEGLSGYLHSILPANAIPPLGNPIATTTPVVNVPPVNIAITIVEAKPDPNAPPSNPNPLTVAQRRSSLSSGSVPLPATQPAGTSHATSVPQVPPTLLVRNSSLMHLQTLLKVLYAAACNLRPTTQCRACDLVNSLPMDVVSDVPIVETHVNLEATTVACPSTESNAASQPIPEIQPSPETSRPVPSPRTPRTPRETTPRKLEARAPLLEVSDPMDSVMLKLTSMRKENQKRKVSVSVVDLVSEIETNQGFTESAKAREIEEVIVEVALPRSRSTSALPSNPTPPIPSTVTTSNSTSNAPTISVVPSNPPHNQQQNKPKINALISKFQSTIDSTGEKPLVRAHSRSVVCFCTSCKKLISATQLNCAHCGHPNPTGAPQSSNPATEKSEEKQSPEKVKRTESEKPEPDDAPLASPTATSADSLACVEILSSSESVSSSLPENVEAEVLPAASEPAKASDLPTTDAVAPTASETKQPRKVTIHAPIEVTIVPVSNDDMQSMSVPCSPFTKMEMQSPFPESKEPLKESLRPASGRAMTPVKPIELKPTPVLYAPRPLYHCCPYCMKLSDDDLSGCPHCCPHFKVIPSGSVSETTISEVDLSNNSPKHVHGHANQPSEPSPRNPLRSQHKEAPNVQAPPQPVVVAKNPTTAILSSPQSSPLAKSTGSPRQLVENRCPKCRVVRLEENLGLCASCSHSLFNDIESIIVKVTGSSGSNSMDAVEPSKPQSNDSPALTRDASTSQLAVPTLTGSPGLAVVVSPRGRPTPRAQPKRAHFASLTTKELMEKGKDADTTGPGDLDRLNLSGEITASHPSEKSLSSSNPERKSPRHSPRQHSKKTSATTLSTSAPHATTSTPSPDAPTADLENVRQKIKELKKKEKALLKENKHKK